MLTNGSAGYPASPNLNARQGLNPFETRLSSSTTPASSYAQFFAVDSGSSALPSGATSNPVMAQPLYVSNITVSSPAQGTCNPCNMLIAVTLNDTVFAWNADGSQAGNLLWSRQGTGATAGNALYYDDCGLGGSPVAQGFTLQFVGILSTPVIDVSGSVPAMYLASLCQASGAANGQYWLHKLNLTTGLDFSGSPVQIQTDANASSTFVPGWQQQRSALLQVKNSGNTSTPSLIYVVFGSGVNENIYNQTYKGCVFAYKDPPGGGALQRVIEYSDEPTSCGTGGGLNYNSGTGVYTNNGQCTGNSGTPSCDCYVPVPPSSFYSTPNWGGHGGGFWSVAGPAATALGAINTSAGVSDNAVHVFAASGNGGFQEFSGSTPVASDNFGAAVLDMRLTSTGYDSTAPFQAFVPKSPASGIGPTAANACGYPSLTACPNTFETLNVYDYDNANAGVTLYKDPTGTPRAVTIDKDGFGYLMTQGNLCGSGTTDTACIGYSSGDPGSWTFTAVANLCNGNPPGQCDRVSSLAYFDNLATTGRQAYLHYWPYQEYLTAIQTSDGSAQPGNGTIGAAPGISSYAMKLAVSCTINSNCLDDQIVPGDTLTLSGCACSGSTCPPVVTSVTTNSSTDSELTLNVPVATAFGTCANTAQNFQYAGYFVTPAHDTTPSPTKAGYPGGALFGTANCTSSPCTNSLLWAIAPDSTSASDSLTRGFGTLLAYTALPNSADHLQYVWKDTDAQTWCASSFARPTVVNGSAYVPTYAFSATGFPNSLCPTPTTSGIPYPSGVLMYH